jgi:hypothetical protein
MHNFQNSCIGFLSLCTIFLLLSGFSFAQPRTNLEIFYSLADSSINLFTAAEMPHGPVKVILNNGELYSVFNNHILGCLKSKGIQLYFGKGDTIPVFSLSIEKAGTVYKDLCRDGFLGSYMAVRELSLKGSYYYPVTGLNLFNFVYTDTIKVEQVKELENSSFKFTTAGMPAEPFFSGLFEPAAALGTAAAAVILFFTVRSK